LAASAVGLLGADGGLLWLVTGVWTVRAMAGTPVGFAWGLACVGAGFRWGTLAVGDLEVATRLVGSTLTSGTPAVRAGMALALVGALAGEAQIGGLRARAWAERAAAAVAIAALAPLFVAAGPADPAWQEALRWALPAAVGTAAVLLSYPYATRLPALVPVAMTAVGVVVALLAS
jgi:hypothetical protein